MGQRYVGIDVGAETIKLVELTRKSDGSLSWSRRALLEHHKEPGALLVNALRQWDWTAVAGAAATGRLGRQVNLVRVPAQQAQTKAYRFLNSDTSATVVSIGSHGFSVLEMRASGAQVFRENSRCSQGTGNFLRQLVERFDLAIEEASTLCADVGDPAPLSGRCPVILKTDMTHLANKGESRARILAGLYDAVCENVQVLIKPRVSPPKVVLIGGVSRSRRVRNHFRRFLARHEMALTPTDEDDALYFEALGSALVAAEQRADVAALDTLWRAESHSSLEHVPALKGYLRQVQRMPGPGNGVDHSKARRLVVGFDIGSTGSKAVALDLDSQDVVWEGYVNTNGNPVGAAQSLARQFVEGPVARQPVLALGATGSGREIVGSLMATCYGSHAVYVLNEIAAHATGALHYDPRVDTIFEIGGQDAKYIRLAEGRVVDAAMNEACSAGTGSFIEEQGRKFAGIGDVVQLGQAALEAKRGVSLGQHCSVFMAEIIDEAVAAGEEAQTIIAGIYDSIIQNYLNRVKGNRSVGNVIFCQGMPFSADALAAAVARQTNSRVIIPPNPGNVGALGISLLTSRELDLDTQRQPVDLNRFLSAELKAKDTFVCRSTKGCGGAGNKCRIDRITTVVDEKGQRFTWGGGCSLYDKGTGRRKLPDHAPDPFRQREELVDQLLEGLVPRGGRKTIAITDEFMLKGLFPFFGPFLYELGFDLKVFRGADQSVLKRGIEQANVPFCAPMQLYHGVVGQMRDCGADFIFSPMVRCLPPLGKERGSTLCPIAQASPDMLKLDMLDDKNVPMLLSPVVDFGDGGVDSKALIESARNLALQLGVIGGRWWRAYEQAAKAYRHFESECLRLGERALAFCKEQDIVPVVLLGRAYTIHNRVLNSNVPAILREQGAIGIPVDCYPVTEDVPVFEDMYWGYGQRILRAAHQVRRLQGIYSIFCSNYSCGPDSFNLHFFGYIMEGKPFAIIETDGHSGDAGTKTRVEAFLYCVHEELANAGGKSELTSPKAFSAIEQRKATMPDIRHRDEVVLVPRMGPGAEALAACFRSVGIRAESLAMPDRETVRVGRRYTSGKECVPMCITLGSLLQRVEAEPNPDERFAFFMTTASGPCRFGVYNLLHKISVDRLGWNDRVRVWSPSDSNYFEGIPGGFSALVFSGFMASDLLLAALYDVRPVEVHPGVAEQIYQRYMERLVKLLESRCMAELSAANAIFEIASGRLFGCMDLLKNGARELLAVKKDVQKPTVLLVGEIYVRLDAFANDFIIRRLEQRGLRCRLAPFNEWLEYTALMAFREGRRSGVLERIQHLAQTRVQESSYAAVAKILGWTKRPSVKEALQAATPYLRDDLRGEAVLTVGGAVHEWHEGMIDGVVSVGPLECMPNKISEAQFFHVAEREGLPNLTLSLNGDPVDPEIVDSFAFDVHTRFREKAALPRESQARRETAQRMVEAVRRAAATAVRADETQGGHNGAALPEAAAQLTEALAGRASKPSIRLRSEATE